MYNNLRPNFDSILMQPISFPQRKMTLKTRCILITVFDLLESFYRPLLTEDNYSENTYVIHTISKVLDLIFTDSKWFLKHKKLDLRVLLKLDIREKVIDWKKLVHICKDCFDERYNIFFERRNNSSATVRLINYKLSKIPILEIQGITDSQKSILCKKKKENSGLLQTDLKKMV
ncbi:hypothetical protein Glove_174g152 [Diversispora epigaea]|uniref:Uncharacterized protein n=1 Tax=Diversispora epigaea TaxID=1348612 RepID=A0A397IYG9_9GLOM|nr:hypothetical protein Glove_174g152 [Diversispora epigaea]